MDGFAHNRVVDKTLDNSNNPYTFTVITLSLLPPKFGMEYRFTANVPDSTAESVTLAQSHFVPLPVGKVPVPTS